MRKILEFIVKHGMITKGDRVIAGVSGGADSVCLFFVLLELQKELEFELSAVVHVNHGLRGADADRDERFVQDLCEVYEIPMETFHVNLELTAKKRKQSLEEAGRGVRREAFEAVRQMYGANKIALAHHCNDNAETFLWNLCRGSGLKGLGAIRPQNGCFIRPLLCMERQEIEAYLAQRGQAFCEDLTNQETLYTRNKLRHLVLPILEEQVNAGAVSHIRETIEQMWELEDYMESRTSEAYQVCVRNRNGESLILAEEMAAFPAVIKKRVIRRSLEEVSGNLKDLGQSHVEAVSELFGKQAGRSLDLPYEMKAVRRYEGVCIKKNVQESAGFAEIKLAVPGITRVPGSGWVVTCSVFPKKNGISIEDIPQKGYTKWFDYDIIHSAIFVRTRKSGDTIAIDREGHRKKIKSWMINEKIPAEERNHMLMIAEENRILWIPGYRMSCAYQIGGDTKQILEIKVTEEEENG